MTDEIEIEISEAVLDAALDAWRLTPWHLGWGREALRNACIVAIKADRKSDARRVVSSEALEASENNTRNAENFIVAAGLWDKYAPGRKPHKPFAQDEKALQIQLAACLAARPPMPEDVAGLCERLRINDGGMGAAVTAWHRNPDGHEAAALIEAQAAEIERLQNALAVASEAINTIATMPSYKVNVSDQGNATSTLAISHARAALDAINKEGE